MSGGVFVVSDIHGHVDDLREALAAASLVAADGAWASPASLYVLGDLFDRGPSGVEVLRYLRSLGPSVQVLLGNHDVLALAYRAFPAEFAAVWERNGGRADDQAGLTAEEAAWLAAQPVMARVGDDLLVHSDTTRYVELGRTIAAVNARVAAMLESGTLDDYQALWAVLTARYDFTRALGVDLAREVLATYGGTRLVHGHSIIGTLPGEVTVAASAVAEPLAYCAGQVLAVDGGRYDGGPLLLVRL